jgi:hypothetical protein
MAVKRVWVLNAPDGSIISADSQQFLLGYSIANELSNFDLAYLRRYAWDTDPNLTGGSGSGGFLITP